MSATEVSRSGLSEWIDDDALGLQAEALDVGEEHLGAEHRRVGHWGRAGGGRLNMSA